MSQVYSFSNVIVTFLSPNGEFNSVGSGTGTIALAFDNDNTSIDVAADGRPQPSKILSRVGTITITMQQTSPFHYYLVNWFNSLYQSDSPNWNATTIRVNHYIFDEVATAKGVMPVKPADVTYTGQAGDVTWTLRAEELVQHAPSPTPIQALTSVKANISSGVQNAASTSVNNALSGLTSAFRSIF